MRRALQPLASDDQALFVAALHGEHAIRGFRNGELANCCTGLDPTILGSDAANADASVGGSVCYGRTVWWPSIHARGVIG